MSAALLFVDGGHDQNPNEDEALATGSLSYLDALMQSDPGACSTRQLVTGILEGFCTLELARRHTTTLFHELGSFAGILEASYERIRHIIPISREFWVRLQTIRIGTSLALRESIQEQPLLADLDNVHEYLALTIGQDTIESVRLLFLNNRNRLIRDELHARGGANTTMFYPQEVVKRACELRAGALIIAHNHPSGDPTPSALDLATTQNIANVLRMLAISLHDHVIVGRRKTFSFRQKGLLT